MRRRRGARAGVRFLGRAGEMSLGKAGGVERHGAAVGILGHLGEGEKVELGQEEGGGDSVSETGSEWNRSENPAAAPSRHENVASRNLRHLLDSKTMQRRAFPTSR